MVSASDREGRNLVAWASRQTSAVFSRAVKYIEETAPAQVKCDPLKHALHNMI